MAINAILTKHLTSERIGFNPTRITFSSLGGQNVIILIIGVILWSNGTLVFSKKYFILGLISSFVLGFGVVFIQNAIKRGPAGPCLATSALSSPLLVIVEAILEKQGLPVMQILAIIIGMCGVFIMVLP